VKKGKKILVTGAMGQIGTELVRYLRKIYGLESVIASGRRIKEDSSIAEEGPFELLDVTDPGQIEAVINNKRVDTIYHLASILSAKGEEDPQMLWEINMNGLLNLFEAVRPQGCSIFFPSSVAVFGPGSPKDKTPQDTITRPTTIYGIAKVTGEMLCDYYYIKYGLDIRSMRYPGIISNAALPGGGTTDYAVEIFYDAIRKGKHICPLKENTQLDFIYMPDVLKGAVKLMEADPSKLKHRNAFNVTAFSITPKQLYLEIKKHIPEFTITYEVDPVKQAIADSWPNSLDDSAARTEWNWNPQYGFEMMTTDMLNVLTAKLS